MLVANGRLLDEKQTEPLLNADPLEGVLVFRAESCCKGRRKCGVLLREGRKEDKTKDNLN